MPARHEEVWDRASHGYARQEHLEERAIACALELAAPGPGDRLLDVATGTGLVLRRLAGRPAPPRTATGLDASSGMLARVGALPAGWTTVQGEVTALPFPDAAFDVAIATYLLQVLAPADRPLALREAARVVAPGGRLVVVTPWTSRAAGTALLAAAAAVAPATLGGLRPHDPRPGLAAAGWRVTAARALRGGYPSLVVLAVR